jgi:glycosyltransferase involved in cell wall biosynthesis
VTQGVHERCSFVARVSVIIPVYNAAGFLEEAVRSALEQPETGEVILIEDGSTDASLEIALHLESSDDRVKLFRHPGGSNQGAGASRNVGILNAAFPFVAFLDADDIYLEGRFRNAVAVLESRRDVDGVYEFMIADFEDDDARDKWYARHESALLGVRERVQSSRLFEALVRGQVGKFSTDAVTLRRDIFERAGLFTTHKTDQDVIMWCKIAGVGNLVPGPSQEPVASYRIHGSNRSFHDPLTWHRLRLRRWEHLMEWARLHDLPIRRRHLLATERIRSSFEINAIRFSSAHHRFVHDLRVLGRVAAEETSLIGHPAYWKCVVIAFGARRVKQLAQSFISRTRAQQRVHGSG